MRSETTFGSSQCGCNQHMDEGCCGHGHGSSGGHIDKKALAWIIIGAVIFAAGMILELAFHANRYILFSAFAVSYIILGGDVLLRAGKNILRGKVFDENFLMAIATLGAFAIGEFAEGVAVMLFYQVGEFFQELAVSKSKKNIEKLMDIRPDYANLLVSGEEEIVSPETVKIGDKIIIKPGEKIPLDGVVVQGESMIDTSALTGESVPRSARLNDQVLSGCVNQNGVLTIEVTQTFGESTVAKIIDLVENAASKKAPTEKFITKFARYYTPVVVILAILIAVIAPLFFGGDWSQWIRRGLIFLVISCPCALVISIPLGFFGGISGAARKGVLVKGGNYLEALNNPEIVVFDKTGTLTKGVFKVTNIETAPGIEKIEILEAAAIAEIYSSHPIALSIIAQFESETGRSIDKDMLTGYNEIAGHGVSVKWGEREILAGNTKLMDEMSIEYEPSQGIGTKIYVADDGKYLGCITIADEIKADSKSAIAKLKKQGVKKTAMLTGDDWKIAQAIAQELGIDEVYAGLLPHEKVEKVEQLKAYSERGGKLIFVGDGINDAPVLATADVGVAMGGLGSDAAIEAADVVLMTDEPGKLTQAIDTARYTRKIVWQNIIFALGVKAIFLILGAFGIATMWEAVFADVGVALIAVFNAMRVMKK